MGQVVVVAQLLLAELQRVPVQAAQAVRGPHRTLLVVA
jgi:hypothetical protein